jgi:hypothetical protein
METDVVGQRALFDYGALDQETQVLVRLRASEIKGLAKRVASDIVEIGGKLAEVKDCVGGNGKFNDWLSSELGWSERTAYNFIAVWQKFHAANFALENVATSALYLLAAPSTPADAVEVVRQIADSGQEVTHGMAKEIVRQAKERKPKQVELIEETAEEEVEEEAEPEEDDGADESPATAAPEPRREVAAKPSPAKSPAAGRPAAWFKTRVEILITLMPGPEPRKIMHTVRAGDGKDDIPFVAVSSGEAELLDVLPPTTRGLYEKAAEAFAKKQTAKPAKKPTAKSKPAAKKPVAKSKANGGKK